MSGLWKDCQHRGKVVLSEPWTNLSAQQYQPTFNNTFINPGTKGGLIITAVEYTMDEAYNGGGCQLITGHVNSTQEMSKGEVRLFKADLHITGPILVSFTFKLCPKDCMDVALQLQINTNTTKPTHLRLCPAVPDDQASSNTEDSDLSDQLIRRYGIPKSRTLTSSVFASPIGQEHYEMFEPLASTFHDSVQQAHGLKQEDKGMIPGVHGVHYLLAEKHLMGCTVQEIRVICAVSPGAKSTGAFKLHLGEMKILDPQVLKQPLALARNIRCLDKVWKSADKEYLLTLTLMWHCPISDGQVDEPAHYNIFRVTDDVDEFLGQAFVEAYRVCQMPVSKTCSSVEFVVQIVTRSGLKKPLGECGRFKLKW
ncbi:hypothetical protein OS493_017920 [Desmophyllum pertusum]|uniref:Cytosolic endo-beta-N-acetylglucosaminidase C-terminal domain-containing protein n=1 Tax=Desmophyllum pertusum TaxID=174260 RepID=A0A9W9YZS5_9CNID|nr:hypothetical protein OS493_017920 [Desmophyllum pertusum]